MTVVDGKGTPISDLTAAEFVVKEGGKAYEITKVEAATAPMQVAVIVDDNGLGVFRPSVFTFVQKIFGRGEFSIVTVLGQVRKVTDFTTSADALKDAIGGLIANPAVQNGRWLLDGLVETGKSLQQRNAARPVIVAVTVGGTDSSVVRSAAVLRQLQVTGATFYVVSLANSLVSNRTSATKTSDLMMDENVNINQVLDEGPKQSGGRRYDVSAIADVGDSLLKVADQLTHQYAISYSLPDGVKPNERLAVTVRRSGATVMAPTKISDK